ncbi:hypothetical protein Tco_1083875, partial [Tanacetum coccineum]
VKFDRNYPRWFLEEDVAIVGKDERNPCKGSSHHLENNRKFQEDHSLGEFTVYRVYSQDTP